MKMVWIFQCDCWKMKQIRMDSVRQWKTISCWCKKNYKHWLSRTRLYSIFSMIKQRCENKNHDGYDRYGWRWIKCEWVKFEDFCNDMKESHDFHIKEYWKINTTIDRINNNWNYCKKNCKWSTRKEQANNKKRI